jgi:hypothetical protein
MGNYLDSNRISLRNCRFWNIYLPRVNLVNPSELRYTASANRHSSSVGFRQFDLCVPHVHLNRRSTLHSRSVSRRARGTTRVADAISLARCSF